MNPAIAPVAGDGVTQPQGIVRLLSVNVGRPTSIGRRRGKDVLSGIFKAPVTTETLFLDTTNLQGDAQGDLRVHGGPDKAVYAYPSEHLPRWSEELGLTLGAAAFGENLTTAGWLEDDVRIGDVWSWGGALLQVAQPRHPCFKLAMKLDRAEILDRMLGNGRTGWYLRVLRPGIVPVGGPVQVVARDPAGVTVRRVHRAALAGQADAEELRLLLGIAPLAASWRRALQKRLAALEG